MKWPVALLAIVFMAMSSCTMAPSPPRGSGHYSQSHRVDPYLRPARNIGEIDVVAHRVAAVAGRRIAGSVETSYTIKGPVASVQATPEGDRITVNPRAAREIPLNAWAFIFGHELAHQVHNFGHRGHTDPAQELRADIIGANYAKKAGYHLVPYLKWMFSRRASVTPTHGDFHERARAMARHFKVGTSIE